MSRGREQDFSWVAAWLREAVAADEVKLIACEKLSGGAIQENWVLGLAVTGGRYDGSRRWVLRMDAPSQLQTSLSRADEFQVLSAVSKAGIAVPDPIAFCDDLRVLGRPFSVMDCVPGVAEARRIVRDPKLSEFGERLAADLGRELAKIHAIVPDAVQFDFLDVPDRPPAQVRVALYRRFLDALPTGHPALEHGLNWLERNAPEPSGLTLCHSDYRTGNYLVHRGRLTAILDWEFACWSDPMEDIGWIMAECWRFGNPHLELGGVSGAGPFLAAYEAESGRRVDRDQIAFWQIMAEARWAIIAHQQGERAASGSEVSLELALTGLMAPEMEQTMLRRIAEADAHVH